MKRIINHFMPTYLDYTSNDPDIIYEIEKSRNFVVTFLFLSFISSFTFIFKTIKNGSIENQYLTHLFIGFFLLFIVHLNKEYKKTTYYIQPFLLLIINGFWLLRLEHYQTILTSISLLMLFMPVLATYLFSNKYAVLFCIAGIGINFNTFVSYNLPKMTEYTVQEVNSIWMFYAFYNALIIIITMFFIFKNNSEKKWRDQLKKVLKEDAHKNNLASIGELSAGISHEINNPLAIISYTNKALMKQKDLSEKEINMHNRIDDTVKRISVLINSLLKLSRSDYQESDKTEKLEDVINDVQNLISEKIRFNNIKFELILNSSKDLEVKSQPFSQLLMNLYKNAIDALEENEIKHPKIQTIVYKEKDSLHIFIKDNGKGFQNIDNIEKIFTPFFTTKEVGKGTGLGLSLSHKIVTSLDGTIKASNDNGATFHIKIPLKY